VDLNPLEGEATLMQLMCFGHLRWLKLNVSEAMHGTTNPYDHPNGERGSYRISSDAL
jgi:hypothetical protein